jgi:hypothetical protein
MGTTPFSKVQIKVLPIFKPNEYFFKKYQKDSE